MDESNNTRRTSSREAVKKARATWNAAPMSVKVIASNWATPVLAAIEALDREMEQIHAERGGQQ